MVLALTHREESCLYVQCRFLPRSYTFHRHAYSLLTCHSCAAETLHPTGQPVLEGPLRYLWSTRGPLWTPPKSRYEQTSLPRRWRKYLTGGRQISPSGNKFFWAAGSGPTGCGCYGCILPGGRGPVCLWGSAQLLGVDGYGGGGGQRRGGGGGGWRLVDWLVDLALPILDHSQDDSSPWTVGLVPVWCIIYPSQCVGLVPVWCIIYPIQCVGLVPVWCISYPSQSVGLVPVWCIIYLSQCVGLVPVWCIIYPSQCVGLVPVWCIIYPSQSVGLVPVWCIIYPSQSVGFVSVSEDARYTLFLAYDVTPLAGNTALVVCYRFCTSGENKKTVTCLYRLRSPFCRSGSRRRNYLRLGSDWGRCSASNC